MKLRTINLDSMFVPVPKPSIEFEMFKFSGGELHIKLNNNIDYSVVEKVIITHRIRNTDGLMAVFLVKDALEKKGVKRFDLVMPYIPYARQDRVCYDGEPFSLKVFTNLVNSANFETVHVFDSHSDVAPALINNCKNHSNTQYIEFIKDIYNGGILLISPDSGANKKTNKLSVELGLDVVKCDKVRDVKTGNLSGFEVFCDDLKGKDCLIVDDICDGGGTFIGLSKELMKKNSGNIYLFVTHGIFSKGLDVFNGIIDHIYTTNSFCDFHGEGITNFRIQL